MLIDKYFTAKVETCFYLIGYSMSKDKDYKM